MRLRRQHSTDTDKKVTLHYKIGKTTLAQLLRRLSQRVQLSDSHSWYWDPLFYAPAPEDTRPCYGVYMSIPEETQGIWIDRPEAVLSDWLTGNGVVYLLSLSLSLSLFVFVLFFCLSRFFCSRFSIFLFSFTLPFLSLFSWLTHLSKN